MHLFFLLLSFISLSSCSKVSYLAKQGHGQLKLQWGGDKNHEVLASPTVSQEIKDKIVMIESYKKFFYEYFNKEITGIYSKTNFLNRSAVTYLLIASPQNEIKAKEFSFPFVGAFPYIGFFDEKDAHAWGRDLASEGHDIFIRPVKAYSTLGHFEDHILSTFFDFDKYSLAELVFHELFHTIFFIKGDVDLNENLANYFSRELLKEYFSQDLKSIGEFYDLRSRQEELDVLIADYAQRLNQLYLTEDVQSKKDFIVVRKEFVKNTFLPNVQNKCHELQLKRCYPMDNEWNNAQFAAWMSYHQYQDSIEDLYSKLKSIDLKHFYALLVEKHKMYEKIDPDKKFSQFILEANTQ